MTMQLHLECLESRDLCSATTVLASLQNPGLRTLAQQDYQQDGSLTRNDVIGLFQKVAQSGTVTTLDLNDLHTLVNNGSILGMTASVEDLASKTVGFNLSNSLYLGQVLCPTGQLTAGKTGSQLFELVDKWFLGMDHPELTIGSGATYHLASGTLFGTNGPSFKDIEQGDLGDCFYLATLGDIAADDPQVITNMFTANGDGTYTVCFYHKLNNGTESPDYVTVDSYLPTHGGYLVYANPDDQVSNSSNILWAALAEKAYAQLAESGWSRPGYDNGYRSLNKGGNGAAPLQQIMGENSAYHNLTATTANTLLQDAQAGMLITLGTGNEPRGTAIVSDHEYYVTNYDSTTQTFTVVNPWGWNWSGRYAGTLSLTLAQIKLYFTDFETANS